MLMLFHNIVCKLVLMDFYHKAVPIIFVLVNANQHQLFFSTILLINLALVHAHKIFMLIKVSKYALQHVQALHHISVMMSIILVSQSALMDYLLITQPDCVYKLAQ